MNNPSYNYFVYAIKSILHHCKKPYLKTLRAIKVYRMLYSPTTSHFIKFLKIKTLLCINVLVEKIFLILRSHSPSLHHVRRHETSFNSLELRTQCLRKLSPIKSSYPYLFHDEYPIIIDKFQRMAPSTKSRCPVIGCTECAIGVR